MSPSRRTLLAAGGAGLATSLAGCAALSTPTVDTRVADGDWPLRYHDTQNTNRNPAATGPSDSPSERWRIRTFDAPEDRFGGYGFAPAPVVADGRLYVGGDALSAHRLGDGGTVWQTGKRGGGGYHGAAYANGGVYVLVSDSSDRYPSALARHRAADGGRRWQRTGDHWFLASPLVAGDTVFANGRETIVAFGTRGHRRWRLDSEPIRVTLPAVTATDRYTAGDGEDTVTARPLRRGPKSTLFGHPPKPRWSVGLQSPLDGALTVGSKRVFATESTDFYERTGTARLRALSTDGESAWSRPIGNRSTTVTAGDGTVYFTAGSGVEMDHSDGVLYSYYDAHVGACDESTGDVRWRRTFPDLGDWKIPSVLADGVLYLPLHDSRKGRSLVRALDADDGHTRWERKLDAPAYHLAVVDDALYVSTADGRITALA